MAICCSFVQEVLAAFGVSSWLGLVPGDGGGDQLPAGAAPDAVQELACAADGLRLLVSPTSAPLFRLWIEAAASQNTELDLSGLGGRGRRLCEPAGTIHKERTAVLASAPGSAPCPTSPPRRPPHRAGDAAAGAPRVGAALVPLAAASRAAAPAGHRPSAPLAPGPGTAIRAGPPQRLHPGKHRRLCARVGVSVRVVRLLLEAWLGVYTMYCTPCLGPRRPPGQWPAPDSWQPAQPSQLAMRQHPAPACPRTSKPTQPDFTNPAYPPGAV